MNYLEASGLIFNVLIAGTTIYATCIFIIWPMVEAFSMLRWYKACERTYPESIKLLPWYKVLLANYELFGRQFERKSHRYGEWMGVGKWRVYSGDDKS